MKPLSNIVVLSIVSSLPGWLPACGQQLVEFAEPGTSGGGVGGNAGKGGAGAGGRAGAGAGGGGSGGASGAGGEAGSTAGGSGEAGGSGQAGSGGEAGGVAGSGGEAGDSGRAGSGGEAGDDDAPRVISTNPADGDSKVAINKTVIASFSEAMNPSSITANFELRGPGVTPVPGEVDYSASGNVASFDPDADLAPNTVFTATITVGATDAGGTPLANDYVWTFTTGTERAQTVAQLPVPLGAAAPFAILASAAITNIPVSTIVGNVGLSPDAGSNISGFSVPATCPEVTGTMYAVDATGPACAAIDPVLLGDAKLDAEVAYLDAIAAVRGTPQAISGNLDGLTLYPGLYESGSSLEISPGGFLYLDAQGDGDAVFIIRSATSITTESTSEVVLTKGAKASNVYWTAGSTVTLGTNSIMKGTLIASTSISLLTGASLEGRALNQGSAAEAITLDAATIVLPTP